MSSDRIMVRPFGLIPFILALLITAPAIAQSTECAAKFSVTSYEIDDESGLSEYAGSITPKNCEGGCSGALSLEFQYAVSRQKTERTLKPDASRTIGGDPFNERTVAETRTHTGIEVLAVRWRSKAGEEVEVEGSSMTTMALCKASMDSVCRPLKLKATSNQSCQQNNPRSKKN